MTYKELNDLVMPEEKRKTERYNLWVCWVVRPLSVLFTLPFINSRITPTDITKMSLLMVILGVAIFFIWPNNIIALMLGWLCFFVWAILDGVDGNLARATNQCSGKGELWDAIGGYAAMASLYFMAGVLSFNDPSNLFPFCDSWWLLVLCGATSLFSIFPRLVFHKKEVIDLKNNGKTQRVVNKKDKSLINFVSLNILSASGFFQVIFLVSILTHTLNWFILAYCVINFGMMVLSINKMVK